jgi:hypothetical protein
LTGAPDRTHAREITARRIAAAPPSGPVQVPCAAEARRGVLAARRLEAAVREDHRCDDRSCAITAALAAGLPQTAAWLLAAVPGDHPALTRLLDDAAVVPRLDECDSQDRHRPLPASSGSGAGGQS